MRLQVNVGTLNKRWLIPLTLPDDANIAGKVHFGFDFEGELVDPRLVPNPTIGKWYKDREGYFYSGKGVVEVGISIAREFAEVEVEYPWWMKQLRIPEIWSTYNERGANAKIAIIDSGYNINNPEIATGVVGTFLHPDFLGNTDINDNEGHGTYCASVIGARNKLRIIGCAPECQLYISKMTDLGSIVKERLLDAIEDAIKNEVDVISISQFSLKFDKIELAIKKAIDKNIIVVAAIGNNNNPTTPTQGGKYPALYSDCIAVGSIDKSEKLSLVTLINTKTEINAPGEDIVGYLKNLTPEKRATSTSIATAIVSGICGLIISHHKKLNKPYTAESIKDLIVRFSDPVIENEHQRIISPVKVFNQI